MNGFSNSVYKLARYNTRTYRQSIGDMGDFELAAGNQRQLLPCVVLCRGKWE